ncbi:restriction endonuclease subunit S [Breoghania sp.]|uniref:restriction endonuclease subunit S n=1 Tax=Breoghania sp. TaxID=2065378 RepID=UPI002AABC974|nr:restriction endonuclease subunit S [Breoghania sp.]
MSELPKGWTIQPLTDLVTFNPKHDPNSDRQKEVSFIPMPAVDDRTGTIIDLSQTKPLSDVWKGYTHFQERDVIFAKITPCMENGKIAVAEQLTNSMACGSTEFHVLRSEGAVEPAFLWRYLRQSSFRRTAEQSMTGAVGQRRVPKQYLEQTTLSLPPLAEQKRIVAKLDALSARYARAREALDRIETLVKRYKQAVLSKAFSGELTKNVDVNLNVIEADNGSHVAALWPVPNTWTWCRTDQVGHVGLGRQRSPKNHTGPQMRPYLRSANITWHGIDTNDVKEMNFDDSDFKRFQLEDGDVLLNEGSGSPTEVGKPTIWRGEIADCCYQNTLLRVQPSQCSSEYLYYYFLLTARAGRFVASTQGVNIQHIGRQGLANFPVPLAPETEQKEIVRRIESAFQKIDRLAAEAKRALELTDKLDEAILAKAFRGELVPQDPNDEPASVLLDRIKAERAAQPKPKRGRGKKA